MKVVLVEDIHCTAYMLDPNLALSNTRQYMTVLKLHVILYAKKIFITDTDVFIESTMWAYEAQNMEWRAVKDSLSSYNNLTRYVGNALMWWTISKCKHWPLTEFYMSTL